MTQCTNINAVMHLAGFRQAVQWPYLRQGEGEIRFCKGADMAHSIFDHAGGRPAPAGGVLRPVVARLGSARAPHIDRRVSAARLGLDDAGIATTICDRRALEQAGRGQFPL